jgi:lysophospholipase L1-like esterase
MIGTSSCETADPLSIHCLGDSITQAAGNPECGRWTAVLQQRFDAETPGRVEVYNHGMGGNTSAMGLDRMRDRNIGPGLTLIQFGLNDASCEGHSVKNRVGFSEYCKNLKAMARIVAQRGGEAVFVTNHLPDYSREPAQPDGLLYSDKIRQYNQGVRDVALYLGAGLIDMEAGLPTRGMGLTRDGLHLNVAGNLRYAEIVYGFWCGRGVAALVRSAG